MKELFTLVLRAGLWGSAIIGLTLLLRLFLRKRAAQYTCILWLLAAVRLLLPVTLESQLSIQPNYTQLPAVSVQTVPEAPSISISQVPQVSIPDSSTTPAPAPVLPEPIGDPIAEPIADPIVEHKPVDYLRIAAVVWSCGAVAILCYIPISYFRMRRKIRLACRTEDGTYSCSGLNGSFVLGYFRPRIYIPASVTEPERGYIRAHEQAHIARKDNWWKLLGFVCVALHWYNPLVWIGYAVMSRDIEYACDARVIKTMDLPQRKAYSMVLLHANVKKAGISVCPVTFAECNIGSRIRRVLSYKKPTLWITAGFALIVTVVLICFMTTSPTAKGNETDPLPVTEPDTQAAAEAAPESEGENIAQTDPAFETTEQTESVLDPSSPTSATQTPTTGSTPDSSVPTPDSTKPVTDQTAPTTGTSTNPTTPNTELPKPPEDSIIAEGTWAGSIHWILTTDGTLTFTAYNGFRMDSASQGYPWTPYSGQVRHVKINEGILNIPIRAFQNMTNLTTVSIARSVVKIQDEAFVGCTGLTSVFFPENVEYIGVNAFWRCTSLRNITFSPNCKISTIDQYAFSCTAITELRLPSSVKVLGQNAFASCESLQYVDLSAGLETMFVSFENCPNIRHLILGAQIQRATNREFAQSKNIETLELYSDLGVWDFRGRTALKTVVIGGSVQTINSLCFENCTALTNVTIQSQITCVGASAFYGCTSLRSITLPGSVTKIESSAFRNSGLTSITIPASVTEIWIAAFCDTPLQEIRFLGSPPYISNNSAFANVTATAYYPPDNPDWTPDRLIDYGGTLTWYPPVAVEPPETTETTETTETPETTEPSYDFFEEQPRG